MMFFDDVFYGPSSLSFARASAPALAYHSYYAPRPRRHAYRVPVRYVDPYYSDDFFGLSFAPRVPARAPLDVFDLVDVVDFVDPLRTVLAHKASSTSDESRHTTKQTEQTAHAQDPARMQAQKQNSKPPSVRTPKKSERRPSTTTVAAKSQSPKKPRTEIFVATFDNENGWRYYKKAADSEQLQQVEGPQLVASQDNSSTKSDGVKQIEQSHQPQHDEEMPALEADQEHALSQAGAASVSMPAPAPAPAPAPIPVQIPVSVSATESEEQHISVPTLTASFHNLEPIASTPQSHSDEEDIADEDEEDYGEYDQEQELEQEQEETLVKEQPGQQPLSAVPLDWSQELELLKAVGFDDREHLVPLLEEIMVTPSTNRAEAQQGLKRVLARLLLL